MGFKFLCWRFLPFLAYAFLSPPIGFATNAPDASQIVSRSVTANDADWKAAPGYTHRERNIHSKLDANGGMKVESVKTYDVMMIEGSPYDRLIQVSNERLRPDEETREAKKLSDEIARRHRESASERQSRVGRYQGERANNHFLMQEMVNAFDFKFVGEEQMNGHACYVLDASPKPDYHPPTEKAKVLTGMKGRLWVSKQGYHWVRVQAEVFKPVSYGVVLAKVRPGTQFELDQMPVNDVWLPQRFIQSVNARILGVYRMQNREESDYSNYRRITATPQS